MVFLLLAFAQVNGQTILHKNPSEVEKSFSKHRLTCMFFFVEDCPVSMRDFSVIRQIRKDFDTSSLSIIGVYVGAKARQLSQIVDSIGIPIRFINDQGHEFVEMAGATITPEYFLFDNKGKLRYRGAIDNYAYGLAKHRKKVTKKYLNDAIQAILDGKEAAIKSSQAYGCFIESPEN